MKTDVVLLPGLHGTTALFDGFIAMAPPWARCRPVALPENGEQSFDGLAQLLEKDLQTLEGFILFGESFSAPVAARLAQRLGSKVSLLVLCNPLVQVSISVASTLGASLLQSRLIPLWAVALAMTGGNREVARAALQEVRRLPVAVLAARLAAATSASREDLLPFLGAPLLGVAGSFDRLVNPRHIEELLAEVPLALYAEVSAPHLAAQVAPAQVWAAISEEYESAA